MASEKYRLRKGRKDHKFGTDDDLSDLNPKAKQIPMDLRERRESGSQIQDVIVFKLDFCQKYHKAQT